MSDILGLLASTRDNDKSVRSSAEAQIEEYVRSYSYDFLTALIELAANPATAVADGQSALLVLKNCVQKYWSAGFEQYVGPPLNSETRAAVRKGLMSLLAATSNHRIRSACALVIGRIGSLEFPDEWPDLLDETLRYLGNEVNSNVVLGGLALFKELLLETFREEDFNNFGEAILNRLLAISELPDLDGRRLMCIQCFRECITFLLMGDDDQLPLLEDMGARFVPGWCSLFNRLLGENRTDSELIVEIVNSIREVDSAFPQLLEPHLPSLFETSRDILAADEDSLDDELKANFAFVLDTALQNKAARRLCLGSGPKIDTFSTLLLKLSVISQELADWWVDDYNEFVTAEQELNTGELHPRNNAAALVAMTGQPAILPRLLDMLHNVVQDGHGSQAQEACLFLISNLLSQVDIDKHLVVVDLNKFQEFLTNLEYTESDWVDTPQNQLLVARKIATAATVAKYGGRYLQDDIKFRLALHAFKAPLGSSNVVRAAQAKAIADGASLYPAAFKSYQSDALKVVADLIATAEGDTPSFLAEAYGSILKVDYGIVLRDKFVLDMLFALSAKDTADIDLNAQILDVIGELLNTVSTRPIVDQILAPIYTTIAEGASNNFEYSGDLYFALDLATAVFEHEGVELSSSERENTLQSFYQVITVTEDPQILQVASFAYAALVQNIQDGVSPEAAGNVLKVAAQLLNPTLTDSAALASGKLVNAIVEKFGSELGPVLEELIDACARRLASAENALLVETLVLVFCDLTLRNAAAVVSILVEKGLLEPVMKQWLPTFEVVRGADEINKNITALQNLFELDDPHLSALTLPDEPIRNPNEILTRRKARNIKFTQIPVPLKILKLLIRELLQAPLQSDVAKYLKQSESDDEWDDELAMDDLGDVVDLRRHSLILDWFKSLASEPVMLKWFPRLSAEEQKALTQMAR